MKRLLLLAGIVPTLSDTLHRKRTQILFAMGIESFSKLVLWAAVFREL